MFTPVIESHTAQVPHKLVTLKFKIIFLDDFLSKDRTVINSQPHLIRTASNCWCKSKAHVLSQKVATIYCVVTFNLIKLLFIQRDLFFHAM